MIMHSLHHFDAYLFDLDGTIYSGNVLLPGVRSALARLRGKSKPVLFVSNTTVASGDTVSRRLMQMGIDCRPDEVWTAARAAGMYFREEEPGACVLLIGEQVMKLELERNGIRMTEDPLAATHVLIGLDRRFTFGKLTRGMAAVRNGALLVAANPDPFCPTEEGDIPDTGSLVQALETASQSATSRIIGKPSPYLAQKVLHRLQVSAARCLMIGDRLETDICFGQKSGMRTALVLTGASTKEDIGRTGIRPDYVLESLEEIVKEERVEHG